VLFSTQKGVWKLTDIGFHPGTTEARNITTRHLSNTGLYLSPEIFLEDGNRNSPGDLWSLGCIAFELATGEKAFAKPRALQQYALSHQGIDLWAATSPLQDRVSKCNEVSTFINNLLSVNPGGRPSVESVLTTLASVQCSG
jgi:serine/threonine protein kinase